LEKFFLVVAFLETAFLGKKIPWSVVQPKEAKQSYYHQPGETKLLYRTIGQQIKVASQKFADNEAIVSCHEDTRLTYAEALDKVCS
jgi:hypothetical protein